MNEEIVRDFWGQTEDGEIHPQLYGLGDLLVDVWDAFRLTLPDGVPEPPEEFVELFAMTLWSRSSRFDGGDQS